MVSFHRKNEIIVRERGCECGNELAGNALVPCVIVVSPPIPSLIYYDVLIIYVNSFILSLRCLYDHQYYHQYYFFYQSPTVALAYCFIIYVLTLQHLSIVLSWRYAIYYYYIILYAGLDNDDEHHRFFWYIHHVRCIISKKLFEFFLPLNPRIDYIIHGNGSENPNCRSEEWW